MLDFDNSRFNSSLVRTVPPLNITEKEVDKAIKILKEVLGEE